MFQNQWERLIDGWKEVEVVNLSFFSPPLIYTFAPFDVLVVGRCVVVAVVSGGGGVRVYERDDPPSWFVVAYLSAPKR